MDLCLGNLQKRVKVSNLRGIFRVQMQIQSVHPKLFDLYNHLDSTRRHPEPLLEVEPCQKDVLVVVSFTLGLIVLLKCVISVER